MYDVVIIGAGAVGGFTARQLSQYDLKILLIEQNNDVCCGGTKANSAIVHSGYSGTPRALKTEMTLRGNLNFHEVCEELDVSFERCGSLMVAIDEKGIKKVKEKYERGISNGVPGLKLLSGKEALKMEPHLNPEVVIALYAPTCGVVNPWEYGLAAVENAVDNGVELSLSTKVTHIVREENQYVLRSNKGNFESKYVINCAGVFSDRINDMVVKKPFFRIAPRRGEYYVLDKMAKGFVKHVIFESRGEESQKGVIVVPTVHGNILVGPSTEDIQSRDATCTTEERLELIKEVSKNTVQNIPFEKTIRVFSGIRPRPQLFQIDPDSGETSFFEDKVKDFILGEPKGHENFINCAGIKSPGLTCANEIGAYVLELIKEKEGSGLKRNSRFNPYRRKLIRFSKQSEEKKISLIKGNKSFGRIICRCESITEGEVVDVIRRNSGARTVDGVKRRVGCGLGRCQGSFCSPRIIKILARELDCSPEEICKDEPGSEILVLR